MIVGQDENQVKVGSTLRWLDVSREAASLNLHCRCTLRDSSLRVQ